MPAKKQLSPLLKQIAASARDECCLDPSQPLLIGVSGGPDSLCLAHALHALHYNLLIAHFDHQLRPESSAEARMVQDWAKANRLPFLLGVGDVRSFAKAQRLSIEEAARTLRYRFLFAQAGQHQAQAVAVAHNADDQVETILMHLLRGAGLSGLKGMLPISLNEGWADTVPLVRPLLGIWRKDIEEYCASESLSPNLDATNNDTTYYRNRLRHQLIPHLESYNPQIRQVIWRTGRALAGDAKTVAAALETAWQSSLIEEGPGFVAFDWATLCAQPTGLQRSLLRKAFDELRPGLRDLDFEVVERGLHFLSHPTRSASLNLALGLSLILEPPRLYLAESPQMLPVPPAWPQITGEIMVPVPGKITLGRQWWLETATEPQHWTSKDDPFQACLDATAIIAPLRLLPPQPADRFCPLGMQGKSQKLADFFINQGLPRRARPNWPLLLCGEVIAWIPGFRPSEHFRTHPGTTQRCYIRVFAV
ncbi:MAG: tRNA lysidine(34) synthetase TilS [Anaerolineaceae bacterium]|nr:tRNA lysidine(34) synthetase TilS [Anaerolineaceae bacterium]